MIAERYLIMWATSGGLGLALVVLLARGTLWRQRPARVAYGALLWLFHFGLTFVGTVVPSVVVERPGWAVDWLFTPAGTLAVVEATVFLASFALATEVGFGRYEWTGGRKPPAPELAWAGSLCAVVGVGLFMVNLYRHGIDALLVPYEVFFPYFSNDFSRAVVVTGFGGLLVLASGSPLHRVWWVLALFAVVGFPVLLAGGRSAPMFVAVALAVMAIQRGIAVKLRWVVAATLVTLSVIAVVRVSREEGLVTLGTAAGIGARAPLEGLTELGGSLAPVYAVIDAEQRWGRQYFFGETYLLPVARVWDRLLGTERLDPAMDPRFIAELTNRHYGSIGFSTVAEAYANGGTVAVVLFAVLWGLVLGRLERYGDDPYGRACLGVLLLPMLFNIRNSFIFVPVWVGVGLAVIGVAFLFRGPRSGPEEPGGSWLSERAPALLSRWSPPGRES